MLAALGIYALISYGVTQRRQEIGIRIALGASAGDVRGAIMRNTLGLAVAGMALGIAGAMLVVPAMNGLLFGVTWSDPVSFVGRALGSIARRGDGGVASGAPGVARRSERRLARRVRTGGGDGVRRPGTRIRNECGGGRTASL